MGLLEELEFLSSRRNDNGVPVKRGPLSRSTDNESLNKLEAQRPQNQEASMLRNRSRLSRFIRFEKVDYLQWICAILVFLFMVILFQAFLPGWVTEKSNNPETPFFEAVEETGYGSLELRFLKELGGLDFGEGIRFEPSKLLEKFQRESREENLTVALTRPGIRLPLRKPHLALVLSDLAMDSSHLLMISVAVSLRAIGYAIQPYSLEDGPSRVIWRNIGLSVNILQSRKPEIAVDWLIFDGVLVSSLGTRDVISCLLQEPFKSLPLIWTIHDSTLALRLRHYTSNGHFSVIDDWKQAFIRATVVVFPDYVLPMRYSAFDAGNFFVIPSSSAESWEAHKFMALNKERDLRAEMGYSQDDFVIAIAGSQFSYSGMWLEHALVMQALVPVFADFHSDNSSALRLKVGILSGNSTSTYKVVLQAITLSIGYPRGSVQLVGMDGDVSSFLSIADLVIYGSFHEEQSFPSLLIRAMCFGKPIVAPDLAIIRKYVDNRVNGYLFPKENISVLTQVLFEAISKGKLSLLARSIASIGKGLARNLMVSDAVEGYAALLGNVIKFPSEVTLPKSVAQIPQRIKKEWQWHLIDKIADLKYWNLSTGGSRFVDKVEELWNHTVTAKSSNTTNVIDEVFSLIDWEEEKAIEIVNARKRLEEELKDRNDQPRGTWEDVYQSARRADRSKNELHERDDRELERTGQPLCIYEPYFGEGTWPFLHNSSLYRGIGLSTKGRRPRADDVDAPSRLPVLTNSYYRDALGEYGAFFALATRIDSVHKNSWIGFHSWRASARKVSLSKLAENALLDAIKKHRHGDALYFWVRMDKDPRNHQLLDFWSFCDAINAGNCRFAVSEALRRMYGVRRDWDSLPPMPADGDSWSVMHSWALPTRSFLELVMFSRMFVDALDAQIYDEHNGTGRCYLSLSKDQHCFTRVLELMVNVWAYHSARRMVYVNPETGSMQVQHRMRNRRGRMWVRWFSFAMLKSMDEDLAEESYSDHPSHRWLWPSTGEVYWQGVYERERTMSQRQKADRKRQSKGNVNRIRRRTHQKALGKYLKVPPEEMVNTNSTATMGSVRKFRRVGGKTPVTV